MAKYRYGWNSSNHKKEYRGKYPDANPRGQGYFGNNETGNGQEFTAKDWETDREFVGSNAEEYTFQNPERGTHTFTAISYEEALRMAEAQGYTASDYKRRRRGR